MGGYLAIDYGTKRTGLAASDPDGIAITNLPAIPTRAPDFWQKLTAIIRERNPAVIVLGLPQQTDGGDSVLQNHLEKLRKSLIKEFSEIKILFFDERYTSKMAERIWAEKQGGKTHGSKKQQKKKDEIDSLAAHILLRSYLDSLM